VPVVREGTRCGVIVDKDDDGTRKWLKVRWKDGHHSHVPVTDQQFSAASVGAEVEWTEEFRVKQGAA
jgi:hypothetical protein